MVQKQYIPGIELVSMVFNIPLCHRAIHTVGTGEKNLQYNTVLTGP